MADQLALRKNGAFRAISKSQSYNKTPMGPAEPPVPYPVTADLSNAINCVESVLFEGKPAFVLASSQPYCKGDEAGTSKGVRSNTLSGEMKPDSASSTFYAGGSPVLRVGDKGKGQGGNCDITYVGAPAPKAAGRPAPASDPPLEAETPEEEAQQPTQGNTSPTLLERHEKAREGMSLKDFRHKAVVGLVKETANETIGFGEWVTQKLAEPWIERLGTGGDPAAAKAIAEKIKFKRFQISGPAEAYGAERARVYNPVIAGAGLLGALKRVPKWFGKLWKRPQAVPKTASPIEEALKHVEPPPPKPPPAPSKAATSGAANSGDGALIAGEEKVAKATTSARLRYMGSTPSKHSKTGREVVERMKAEGLIQGEGPLLKGNPNNLKLVGPDGKLALIDSKVDMAHTTDAVKWWNETGRNFGAKSPEVRKFMLDPNNYTLQSSSINRSAGASLRETYKPPTAPNFRTKKR